MNYARIYGEFIRHRRALDTSSGYFEKHHVVPRSLGGGDDAENIVRLSPSDHLFAHLLLAKIHGGEQWLAVWCMVKMCRSKKRENATVGFGRRRLFAVARAEIARAKSERMTGTKYRARMPVYEIFNLDGRAFKGPLSDLHDATGVSHARLSHLAAGMQGKTRSGWFMNPGKARAAAESKSTAGRRSMENLAGANRRSVVCIETGQVFESISAASQFVGTPVKNAFKPGRTKAGGYSWAYAHQDTVNL